MPVELSPARGEAPAAPPPHLAIPTAESFRLTPLAPAGPLAPSPHATKIARGVFLGGVLGLTYAYGVAKNAPQVVGLIGAGAVLGGLAAARKP